MMKVLCMFIAQRNSMNENKLVFTTETSGRNNNIVIKNVYTIENK